MAAGGDQRWTEAYLASSVSTKEKVYTAEFKLSSRVHTKWTLEGT